MAINEEGVQRNGIPPIFQSLCPRDSVDPADTLDGFPVTLYMDYGTGCAGTDGKVRKGMIRAVFYQSWDNPVDTVDIFLDNYFVNGIQYEGTIRIIKNQNTYRQIVTNGKCKKSTWNILWGCDRTFEWLDNGTPLDPSDDTFKVRGTADGTNREGKTFEVQINSTDPLVRPRTCAWITKGIMELTPEGKSKRIIDFGNGNCDNKATITIDGNKFQFDLN